MNLKQNAAEIKRLIYERKENIYALRRFLISKGIALPITEEIIAQLYDNREPQWDYIKELVAQRVNVSCDLQGIQKLVLVGPTGVGKTTCILKLAAHYSKQKIPLSLMSLDPAQQEVLRTWAYANTIPYHDTIDSVQTGFLLVDTPGCNFYLPSRIDQLGEMINACGEGVGVFLTLSAATKEIDLYGAIHQFSPLSPMGLVFTKLDETLAPGILINICAKTDLPISFIAQGFPLPGEIEVADRKKITHKILTNYNNEEFHFLRQLTFTELN